MNKKGIALKKISIWILSRHHRFWAWFYLSQIPGYAFVYWLVQGFTLDEPLNVVDAVYFSVVTITTLGYGDILPSDEHTKLIAVSESVLGIVTIGLFLSALSHSKSEQIRMQELQKQIRKDNETTLIQIANHSHLLFPLLFRFEAALINLTRSISDKETSYNQDFEFSMMAEIYDPSFFSRDAFSLSRIQVYYRDQQNVRDELRDLIVNVDLTNFDELRKSIIDWIRAHWEFDYSAQILEVPSRSYADSKIDYLDQKKKLIREYKDELKFRDSNSMNAYIALYFQIKELHRINQLIKAQLIKINRVE